ncbi:DUF3224 domain-containing protein [uncultured Amnibacterium sp.]|uniref:DUF3224 domain-containing protein n=1 Tax=uncultured Amnibacterium sp. TaxID=1631851 RepID=UPI0035CB3D09
MTEQTVHAEGTIEVSRWEPAAFDEIEGGSSLVQIDVAESLTGDLVGQGAARMLQVLRPDGSATFCAVERITGVLAGRHGTFVLQDTGVLGASGDVSGTWSVVPGSGTGRLAGLRGDGGFSAVLGSHATFTLDYRFEEG